MIIPFNTVEREEQAIQNFNYDAMTDTINVAEVLENLKPQSGEIILTASNQNGVSYDRR